MIRPVTSICRAAIRKDNEPLNILTFPTHERYESGLCLTNHQFYAFRTGDTRGGIKDWNRSYAPLPANYSQLNPKDGMSQIPLDVDFDLVMSQNLVGQFPMAKRFSEIFHLPIVSAEHTLPTSNYGPDQLNHIRKTMRGNINVFVHEHSRRSWMCEEDPRCIVINQGIDTDYWSPGNEVRENTILAVVNDWKQRAYHNGLDIFEQVTKNLPVKILGNSPGLSKQAKNTNELREAYRKSRIYIWTARISPAPMSVLEAMACGCAVISNATCNIPDVIQHGVNGLISTDLRELRSYCEELLHDEELAIKLGQKARESVVKRFNLPQFVQAWKDVFNKAKDMVYTGEPYED